MANSRLAKVVTITCVGMLALSTIPASAATGGTYDASGPTVAVADSTPCRTASGPPVGLLDRRPSCFTMELFVEDFREFYIRLADVVGPYQDHWLVSGGKVDGILADIDDALATLDDAAGGAADEVTGAISSATDTVNLGLGSISETFNPMEFGGGDPLAAFQAAGGFADVPQQVDVALGLFGDIGVGLVPGQCPNTTSPVAVLLLEQIVERMGEVIELLPQDLVIVALAGSTISAHPIKIVMQAAKIVLTEIMYLGQQIDENATGCAEAKERALSEIMDEKVNELIVQSARTLTAIDVASADSDEMLQAITEARALLRSVDQEVRDVGRDVISIEDDVLELLDSGDLTLDRISVLLSGQAALKQTADTTLATTQALVAQLAAADAGSAARDARLVSDVLALASQNTLTLANLQTLLTAAVESDRDANELIARSGQLSTSVGLVDARLRAVETDVAIADGHIGDVGAAVAGVRGRAEAIDLRVAGVGTDVDDLDADVVDLDADVAGVLGAVGNVGAQLGLGVVSILDYVADLDADLAGVDARVASVFDAVGGVHHRTDEVDTHVGTVFDRVGVVGASVDGVGIGVLSALDALGQVGTRADVIDGRAIGLEDAVADLDGDVAGVGTAVLTVDDHVAEVRALAEALVADLTAGRADLTALGPRHDAIEVRFTALDDAIAALAAALGTGLADVAADTAGVRGVADATATELGALTEREIETSLSRCDPVITLMLPASEGGHIARVEALLVSVIDRAERVGFGADRVSKAREKLTKAREKLAPGTYHDAYKYFCESYDELY